MPNIDVICDNNLSSYFSQTGGGVFNLSGLR